jgi:hypothetical protein
MEKSVREQVEGFQTAAEVWVGIEKQFSGKSNKMQVSTPSIKWISIFFLNTDESRQYLV